MPEQADANGAKCHVDDCSHDVWRDGLCRECWEAIDAAAAEGIATLEQFLRLEIEFVVWCEQHGQPNPHE